MSPEREARLKAMNLPGRVESLTRELVDLLTEEQRNMKGEFADQSVLDESARARLKYFITEGFIDVMEGQK